MSEYLKAIPQNYIFEANDSLYKVVKAETLEGSDISLVGYFPNLILNLAYEFEGEMILHPKFGGQFKVKTFKRLDVDNKEGIVEYLSSDLFKGIGEKTAEKIYEQLGNDAIKKIIEDKSVLKKIKGFNDEKIESLYQALLKNENVEKIFVELYNYGLTPTMVNKLYSKYENKTLEVVKNNPYRLIYEVEGFGFIKTDKLAIDFGFSYNDKIRIEEGILYTLINVCGKNGFSFLTDTQLINSSLKLLNNGISEDNLITLNEINTSLLSLLDKNRIVYEENRYYPISLYNAEVDLAKRIVSINTTTDKIYSTDRIIDVMRDVELTYNIEYTQSQKKAIISTINSKVSIITGGPGTGKTTLVKGVLNILAVLSGHSITDDKFRNRLLLVAPTGRAAKRLGSSCNVEASTIHKALGYNYSLEFEYNEDNKLNNDIIIIDEFSMVDVVLASNLFKAIKDNAKVIIVGDSNQLPSVAPGNVLNDLIESGVVETSVLTDIMRQDSMSDIIKLSTQINNQRIDMSIFNKKDNRELYFYNDDSNGALDKILIFTEAFLNGGGNILTDLQILIPMYNGICGINEVNKRIQSKFNLSEEMIVRGEKVFKKNDKVLQLQNNPELQIMNGDIGYIKDILKTDEMDYLYIDFDGLMVKYPASELENLTLAYAISIHKSQGSEYDNVILPILPSYYTMLKRKLIYTAVTRAKKKLIVIGSMNSLLDAIKRADDLRQTTLIMRLNKKSDIKKTIIYINDPDIPFKTLGEEGMEGITPYTFMEK